MLFTIFFLIRKQDIRNRMKDELKTRSLETIVIPEKKVKWMDKHEIWVNNRMFDICTQKFENGIFTFTGLFDDEETELMIKEKETKEKNKDKLLAQFIQSIQNLFCNSASEEDQIKALSFSSCLFISLKIIPPFLEINTPPPQVVYLFKPI